MLPRAQIRHRLIRGLEGTPLLKGVDPPVGTSAAVCSTFKWSWEHPPARADLKACALGEEQRDGLKIAVGPRLHYFNNQ